ncbi:hypothetical protein WR25_06682 [Diploscapter pachys]|uniref:Arginyl-tRNA--protein transferase 1 n=1 Tax=Diploscapter pachys TaxID=2018661 RepID=A0A2A2K0W0_9BILA|nr:hypothetical protein WR25_06682 [Diploscapter pachys]
MTQSIVEYFGWSRNGSCGYCKGKRPAGKVNLEGNESNSQQNAAIPAGSESEEESFEDESGHSVSLGAWAHNLKDTDFMILLEAGWSTSGKYLYKPKLDETCCPQYTIRLDTTKFYLSRSQKSALKKMNAFLKEGKKPRCGVKEEVPVETKKDKDVAMASQNLNTAKSSSPISGDAVEQKKRADVDRPVRKKKEIRRERFEQKCRDRGIDTEEARRKRQEKENAKRRTIESFILNWDESWKHKLEVRLVSTQSQEFAERETESFQLYSKYQMIIHNDEEKMMGSYKRFLVDSPLKATNSNRNWEESTELPVGAYHLWYLLDDKLIAAGVVDLLTKCLSAKYFFYDPDYNFLSLGTYSALREIHLTRQICAKFPQFKYYYMGYYIQTCPKMRYKGTYRPSELLCDRTWQWVPLSECEKLFPASNYTNGFTAFRPDLPTPPEANYQQQAIYCHRTVCRFADCARVVPRFRPPSENFIKKLKSLVHFLGKDLSEVAIFFQELNNL